MMIWSLDNLTCVDNPIFIAQVNMEEILFFNCTSTSALSVVTKKNLSLWGLDNFITVFPLV